ncbi:MAG: 2-oxoglutarate dehydrogenase E1 component [Verrucomicrobiota bacterium]
MQSSVSARLNASLLDEKYALWKIDPQSVEPTWSAFFEGFEIGSERSGSSEEGHSSDPEDLARRALVVSMIYNYRILGHTQADVNPLADQPDRNDRLRLENLGFRPEDLDRQVKSTFFAGAQSMTLREMIAHLEKVYCGKIGYEFMHIHNDDVRHWLRDRIDSRPNLPLPPSEEQKSAFRSIVESEAFEQFLHRKYVGQKRFGLEGGESLLVALNTILEACPGHQIQHLVMGMAHRGRLNVLANFLRKPLKVILHEFSENYVPNMVMGDGDVKYHLGFETVRDVNDHKVGISLAANPSHLEAVNGVVEGKARARQRALNFPDDDGVNRRPILPILIHGDAAFAGQGTVAEVLNLSQVPGYRTGGTIHLITNNQIGFTTTPDDARSSAYCTDVAKMIEAPVLHVNGDHPLEVAYATQLALEFRQTFKRDIVVDIVCYRLHGHNEGDEPSFTLPNLYRNIRNHPSPARQFEGQLVQSGVLTTEEAQDIRQSLNEQMDREFANVKEAEKSGNGFPVSASTGVIQPAYSHDPFTTGISNDDLRHIGSTLTSLPDGFRVNEKLEKRFIQPRRDATKNGGPYNWAFAESLAFGSLLLEGRSVRLSGQDCRRGTFSQRHAVLYDADRNRHFPLRHLSESREDQGRFYVYNSILSEAAVLGFEYGYSIAAPDMLVLWEAQFGDFANGAQVMIDQFICSAESKWSQPSNVVLLLPHGYEGMGPEHSSARIERFLQLCAENNIQVCNLTSPAQYFHLLRRQALRPVRKPLILATPKSLLNHPACVSHEADLTGGTHFQEIIDDPGLVESPNRVTRLIFCTGKVYFDLLAYRNDHQLRNVAIVRMEQLYPFHYELLRTIISRYPRANKKWVWCQEEPANMGAWTFMAPRLQHMADQIAGGHVHIRYAGRDKSASPAAGSKAVHSREQRMLVEEAFSV